MAETEEVDYVPLLSAPESDGEEKEPPPVSVHSVPENGDGRWSHVGNLDEFFTRIYEFYMYSGFAAIALEQVIELVQFLFIAFFAAFLVTTVRLDNLFGSGLFPEFDAVHNVTDPHGRTAVLSDVIDVNRLADINPVAVILLLVAMVVWGHHLIKALWKSYKFWEIRCFYIEALHIPPQSDNVGIDVEDDDFEFQAALRRSMVEVEGGDNDDDNFERELQLVLEISRQEAMESGVLQLDDRDYCAGSTEA